MKVLVTGASGYIGSALLSSLPNARGAYRRLEAAPPGLDAVCIGELGPDADWRAALDGVEAVVHLAGVAHRKASAEDYQRINVSGTERLVRQAVEAGVRRFIFMSSIKATADASTAPLSELTPTHPADAYGRSKRDAEKIVLAEPSLNAVVLRPPLVFSADAKANFAALLRLAATPWPLPIQNVRNLRSMISREALVAALASVLAKAGPTGVFHLSMNQPISTPDLVACLREGMGQSARLFGLPATMLNRLLPAALRESLVVDDSAFRAAYDYGAADTDIRSALRATGAAWRQRS